MQEKQTPESTLPDVEFTAKEPASNKPMLNVILLAVGGCLTVLCIIILCLILAGVMFWINSNPNTVINGSQPLSTPLPNGKPTPELIGTKQYSFAPPMLIDIQKQYFATVKMAKGGEFVIQLYPNKAPNTVNNFVFLASQRFFDGLTFYRVLEGFVAQTGDPTERGTGGAGYMFANEKNDLAFDKAGMVGMANIGPDTNSSQFFISLNPLDLSGDDYTIFGQVISGMDVVNGLTRRDPQSAPNFLGDAIDTITITDR